MRLYNGGVTSPKGYLCSAAYKPGSAELYPSYAMLRSRAPANAAMILPSKVTSSAVVSKENLAYGVAETVIFDRTTANYPSQRGRLWAMDYCEWAERIGGVISEHTILSTVGVQPEGSDIDTIKTALNALFDAEKAGDEEFRRFFANDLQRNSVAIEFSIGDKECRIGGVIGNCSSPLDPLVILLTTDVAIDSERLNKALSECYQSTIGNVCRQPTVCDSTMILANAQAENSEITSEDIDYCVFSLALKGVMNALCKIILSSGDKEFVCSVVGAEADRTLAIAKSILSNEKVLSLITRAQCPIVAIVSTLADHISSEVWSDVSIALKSEGGMVELMRSGECADYNEGLFELVVAFDRVAILVSLGDGDELSTAYRPI